MRYIIMMFATNIYQSIHTQQQRMIIDIYLIKMINNNHKSSQQWTDYQCLHKGVIQAMLKKGLQVPTQIQAEVFREYDHYYDFLVAAQTGSGKTLAFAAPVLSQLQLLREKLKMKNLPHCILGLVLTPTRQLAQQIYQIFQLALSEINKLYNEPQNQIKVISIIGGMSKQKQLRLLCQRKPQIIIGTPGRLHELLVDQVLSFEHLKYLIIDEADRMVQMGHFKQIDIILAKIFTPCQEELYEKDLKDIVRDMEQRELAEGDYYVKQGGKRVKLKFNVNSLATDQLFQVPAALFQIYDHKANKKTESTTQPIVQKEAQTIVKKKGGRNKFKNINEPQMFSTKQKQFLTRLKRRIFFVSATLTRQFKDTKYFIKKPRTQEEWKTYKQQRKDKRKTKDRSLHDDKCQKQKYNGKEQKSLQQQLPKLKALLSRAQFSSKPKIIDLSSLLFLPQSLTQKLCYTESLLQRLSVLLAYLEELPPHSKVIIFSNTIKACQRIQFFVEAMGWMFVNLHSHMQQKQRIKKLQKFKNSKDVNILIATDVAARGLDFKISHVVQVGVPVNGDTYVHRAGRTARASMQGESLVIVDKKQMARWTQITDVISESSPSRKVGRYAPLQMRLEGIREKVDRFEWIRVNKEKHESAKSVMILQQDADMLGVQVQQEAPRKQYYLDREQQEMVRHQVKRTIKKIRKQNKVTTYIQDRTNTQPWKQNRLVLTLDQIKQMI